MTTGVRVDATLELDLLDEVTALVEDLTTGLLVTLEVDLLEVLVTT